MTMLTLDRSELEFIRKRSAYTLIELIISMAASTILVSGLASALYISSHALDESVSSGQASRAGILLDQIMSDLSHAQLFSERTATAITFTVPDRDNDGRHETIRYSWSGTPGDPLVYQLNGGTSRNLAESVNHFNLASLTRNFSVPVTGDKESNPVVLFVSESSPNADDGLATATIYEQACVDQLEAWSYDVQVISQDAEQEAFEVEVSNAVVVYVAGNVSDSSLGSKLDAVTRGVVIESPEYAEYGGMTGAISYDAATNIEIADNQHYVTEEQTVGVVTVLSASADLKYSSVGVAAGGMKLANANYTSTSYPSLLAVSPNAQLVGGGSAPGRRVQLPWGSDSFSVSSLNSNGLSLMQRAVAWAAGAGDDMYPAGITFEEFTEQQESSNTYATTIAVPSGSSEGDLLIAAVVTDSDVGGIIAENGWNEIENGEEDGKVSLGVWWKLAEASEPSEYTFAWDDSEKSYGWIMRFKGHDSSDPIDAVSAIGDESSTPISPGVSTSVDSCMILRIGGFDDDDVPIGDAGVLGHTTITAQESDSSSSGCSGAAAYIIQDSAGNSGTLTFTLDGSEESRAATIAIKPKQD